MLRPEPAHHFAPVAPSNRWSRVVTSPLLIGALLAGFGRPAVAQDAPPVRGAPTQAEAKSPAWYDKLRIRGYGQVRFNRLLENNDQFRCEQCDRSWGEDGGVFIRRARVIVQGYVHPQVFIYLQPDFASSVGSSGNVAQLRDWYVDLGLDKQNTFRVRVGQSKVPYSFENMQSSQNRLPLDRADATNSAAANERDLGAFFMWAPKRIRDRFAHLVNDNLKGSGDYGVLTVGVFNGQTANKPEANDNQHVVARATYPLEWRGQIIEPSVAAYTGKYTLVADQRTVGVKGREDWTYRDERVVTSLSIAPQPFGVLAEYNVGRGPEYNPVSDSIETQALRGGFVTATYRVKKGGHTFFPFTRWQVYDGGKKHERDARSYDVRDIEFGVEWQPHGNFEMVAEWYRGDRRFEDSALRNNRQVGHLLRLQAQFNF
ncbi:MAG TPA: porin [Gemmatimonas sp.]|uniref:porin n=1 Tax=Gemmatimonas sp. TaxID=1962908 RepID=UPI002ED9C575